MPVVTRIGKLIVEIRESSKTAITQLSYVMFLVFHLLNYAKISKKLLSTTCDRPQTCLKVWQYMVVKDYWFPYPTHYIINQEITSYDCKANLFAHHIIYK